MKINPIIININDHIEEQTKLHEKKSRDYNDAVMTAYEVEDFQVFFPKRLTCPYNRIQVFIVITYSDFGELNLCHKLKKKQERFPSQEEERLDKFHEILPCFEIS